MKYGTGTVDFDFPDLHIPYKEELKQYNDMRERVRYNIEHIKKSYVAPEKTIMLSNLTKIKIDSLNEELIDIETNYGMELNKD